MLKQFRKWMNFNPPKSLSMDGWADFEDEFKKEAPIRYVIKYAIVRKIGYFFDRIGRIVWNLRYRFIHKDHLINTKLGYGYHEVDERMLHGNFELLVDYVEIQCANMATVFKPEKRKAAIGWRYHLPSILRFKRFRSRELGMKHLEWETTLGDPSLNEYERSSDQAARAVQIIILYTWWKDAFPNRKELEAPDSPDNSVGLRFLSAKWKKDHPEYSKAFSQWGRDSFQQELDWDKEDEEMLIALMKIRKALWT